MTNEQKNLIREIRERIGKGYYTEFITITNLLNIIDDLQEQIRIQNLKR